MSIELLEIIYNPKSELPKEVKFYIEALKEIQLFDISSQVYYLLQQQGRLDQTPVFFQCRLKEKYTETAIQNMVIKSQTKLIFDHFEKLGIEVSPLKGTVFAEKYFGHFAARQTTDIDILIKPDSMNKAITCLNSLGFITEGQYIPSHFHLSFSKEIPGSPYPLNVEVHWDILKEDTSQLQIHEFWDDAIPYQNYHYVKELSDYHTFYMICLHGWKHNLNSLRYFIDIVQLIHILGKKVQYERLWRDTANHKTKKRITRTLQIVYEQFPHLYELVPYSKKRAPQTWWVYEAFRNPNQRSIRQYVNLFCFQVLDYDTWKHKRIALSRWLVPNQVELYFEVKPRSKRKNYYIDYLSLYKKRIVALLKLMIH